MDTDRAEESPNNVDVAEIEQENPIRVPNWIIEGLAWIKRTEMAESKLSTSCWTFNQLCGPQLHGRNVKPHFVDRMELIAMEDESGILQAKIVDGKELQFPLPNVPPPDYILGFKELQILFLDNCALEFLNGITPKLNHVQLCMFDIGDENGWGAKEVDKRTAMLDCLLNMLASKIHQFELFWRFNFAKFDQLFPGFIDRLDSFSTFFCFEPDIGVLYKWLTDRAENGGSKQKILELRHSEDFPPDFSAFFARVKQEFTKATIPANFLMNFKPRAFGINLEFGEFTLENEKTGEVLVSYQKQNQHYRLLLRCPKEEVEHWKEEGEKKLEQNRDENAPSNIAVRILQFGAFNNMA